MVQLNTILLQNIKIIAHCILLLTCQTGLSQSNWKAPYLPKTLEFAGEKVPLEDQDVKDRLYQELAIQTYKHGTTHLIFARARSLRPIIEEQLESFGVPKDFFYLAVIESDLKPNAISHKGAVGYWQFLAPTAKEYGLIITDHIDQRQDIYSSTEAIAKYLYKAYQKFSSWTLAAAAVNRGRSGVINALQDQGIDNYYDLYLHEETARYVYRILAMKLIMENPRAYGYDLRTTAYQPIETREIAVSSSIESLPKFAAEQNTNYKMLKRLNPWIQNTDYRLVIPDSTTFTIRLPK